MWSIHSGDLASMSWPHIWPRPVHVPAYSGLEAGVWQKQHLLCQHNGRYRWQPSVAISGLREHAHAGQIPSSGTVVLRGSFCSSLFPVFTLGLVMPLWSFAESRPMSWATLLLREEDYHVNLTERKKVAHCPYPHAAYSEKWLQGLLSGAGKLSGPAGNSLKDRREAGLSSVPAPTHTPHSAELAGWRRGNNTCLKQGVTATALCPGSHMLWEVCASLLHRGSKTTCKAGLVNKEGSSPP